MQSRGSNIDGGALRPYGRLAKAKLRAGLRAHAWALQPVWAGTGPGSPDRDGRLLCAGPQMSSGTCNGLDRLCIPVLASLDENRASAYLFTYCTLLGAINVACRKAGESLRTRIDCSSLGPWVNCVASRRRRPGAYYLACSGPLTVEQHGTRFVLSLTQLTCANRPKGQQRVRRRCCNGTLWLLQRSRAAIKLLMLAGGPHFAGQDGEPPKQRTAVRKLAGSWLQWHVRLCRSAHRQQGRR